MRAFMRAHAAEKLLEWPLGCAICHGMIAGRGQRLSRVAFELLLGEGKAILNVRAVRCLQPDSEPRTRLSVVDKNGTMSILPNKCIQKWARVLQRTIQISRVHLKNFELSVFSTSCAPYPVQGANVDRNRSGPAWT